MLLDHLGIRRLLLVAGAVLGTAVATATTTAAAGTLAAVEARGEVSCGVSDRVPGFATVDRVGRWSGIDVDFCRAIAAAVLGDSTKIAPKPVSRADGFRALATGEIDLLLSSAPWTLSGDTEFKARFVDVLVYDGQSFLVPRSHGLLSVLELSGSTICAVSGTRSADAVAHAFGRHRMRFQLVERQSWSELLVAYGAGACTALTGDVTQLATARQTLTTPGDHVILPEFISKEPHGPAVRMSDPDWFAVVRWVRMALIEAEELSIDSSNVNSMASSPIEDVRRLLGTGSNLGQPLGLDPEWARRIIGFVGNYGEIYERNFGAGSDLKLARGYNRLWSSGGLMYAAPVR